MDNGSGKVRLLVWDERDVLKNLAEVIGREPELADNPVMESVFLWLMDRCADDEAPTATVFKSVLSGTEEITAPKVIELRQSGFSVFVRGADNRDDGADFTSDIMTQIDRTAGDGRLAEVIVASHVDTFESRLESLATQGVKTAVVGFRERAGFAASNPKIDFIDLESITELFRNELPRTNLYDIPEDGRALAPLGFPTRRSRRGATAAPSTTSDKAASTSAPTPGPSTPAPVAPTATSPAAAPSTSTDTATPATSPTAPRPVGSASTTAPAAPPPPPAPGTPKEGRSAPAPASATAPPPPAPSRTAPPPPAAPIPAKATSAPSPIAAAPVVGAAAVAGAGVAAASRANVDQPTREAVFDHVSDLVAAHGSGEGLRAAELDAELDRKFPGFDETAIGFGDRDELAEAVANDRNFVIERDDLDRPILQLRSEAGSSGSSALDDLLSGIKPPRRRSRT